MVAIEGHVGVVKILLEREDVNPNIAAILNGRTPLSHAAGRGHEGIVKMLLDRNDIRTDIRDYENNTALSWALHYGHDKIASMISERAAIQSDTADHVSQESLPLSAGGEDEFMAETELRDNHAHTSTANFSGEPTSQPGDPNVPEELSDWEGSIADSADSTSPLPNCPAHPTPLLLARSSLGILEAKLPLIRTTPHQRSQSRPTSI